MARCGPWDEKGGEYLRSGLMVPFQDEIDQSIDTLRHFPPKPTAQTQPSTTQMKEQKKGAMKKCLIDIMRV